MIRVSLFCGVFVMSGLIGSSDALAGAGDYPGAAKLWTSDHPSIQLVRTLIDNGEFSQAETLLRDDTIFKTDAERRVRDDSLETIRRIRRDFNLTQDDLVSDIRKSIEDFTEKDLLRLVGEGQVTCRVIDGEVHYFRREPGVMYRFSEEIKRRREEWDARRKAEGQDTGESSKPLLDEDRSDFTLNDHLAEIASAGRSAADAGEPPIISPRRFRVRYTLTVKPASDQIDPALMRKGSQLSVWLPFPQAYRQQSDVTLVSASIDGQPYEPKIAPSATDFDGSAPIGGSAQRTTFYQATVAAPTKPVVFEEVFEYTMAGHYPVLTQDNTRELTDAERAEFSHYLQERPPHLIFNAELASLSHQLVGDETNPYLKAKALFDWWDANIRWLPELEYATIPSFANLCMKRKRGDCGVQAVTLMSMMRSVGIPARWQSGLTTTPGKENLHDWTEIYLPPHGWVVADPSYGYRTSDNPDVKQFYLGHMDAYRIIINLDYGRELNPPKDALRSEPADFQRGEVEVDGVNLYFDDWKWGFVVESIEPTE
jgi:transglutaminase-like putative cysteine protease